MPCDAHRSWKKGDCPSCGQCRCCPAGPDCAELGKHTFKKKKKRKGSNKKSSAPAAAAAASSSGDGGVRTSKKKEERSSASTVFSEHRQQHQQLQLDQTQQLYHVDDRIFAQDKTGVYEAIVKNVKLKPLKSKTKSTSTDATSAAQQQHTWSYYVHYCGWSSRWDKWMSAQDLLPDTPEVRAEAERLQKEAAERERERKARQKERRDQKQQQQRKRKRAASADGQQGDDQAGAGGGRGSAPTSPVGGVATKKRKMTSSPTGGGRMGRAAAAAPSQEDVQTTLVECSTLPFTLKTILIDDKAKITRLGYYVASGYDDVTSVPNWTPPRMVHVLPSAMPIKSVLKQFWKEKKKAIKEKAKAAVVRLAKSKEAEEGSDCSDLEAEDIAGIKQRSAKEEEKWKAFIQGILNLFNEVLPPFLLYNQERTHYLAAKIDPKLLSNDTKEENNDGSAVSKVPSDIYGAEYLLRLFVRLPQITATSTMSLFPDRTSLTCFADGVSELVVFLQKHKDTCFKGRYRSTKEIEWTAQEMDIVKKCASNAATTESGENTAA